MKLSLAPWESLSDRELSLYLDETMYFMHSICELSLLSAWKKLDGFWPENLDDPRERDFFFQKSSLDLALALAWGTKWHGDPRFHSPQTFYVRLREAVNDGSWNQTKINAYGEKLLH